MKKGRRRCNNDNITTQLLSGGPAKWASFRIGTDSLKGAFSVAGFSGSFADDAVANDIILRSDTSSQRLFLNSGTGTGIVVTGGNVGIGVTNPGFKIDVKGGDARIFGSSYGGSGDKARLYLGDGNAGIAALYGAGLRLCVYKSGGGGTLGNYSYDALTISESTGGDTLKHHRIG